MKTDFAKDLVKKIEQQALKPRPKWQFMAKEIGLWFLFGITVLIGGVASGLIMFLLKYDFMPLFRQGAGFRQMIMFFPFLWVIVLIIFVVLAYFNWEKTKKGYKINPVVVMIASIIISLILGAGLFAVNAAKYLEMKAYKHLPGYERIFNMKGQKWLDKKENIIAGEALSVIQDEKFRLKGFKGDEWLVFVEDVSDEQQKFKKGDRLIVVGEKEDGFEFEAEHIKPWYEVGVPRDKAKRPIDERKMGKPRITQ
jgi:hypothetical protein